MPSNFSSKQLVAQNQSFDPRILNPHKRQQPSSTAAIVESKQALDKFNVLPSHSGKAL